MEKGNSRLKNEELTEILISQICRQLSRRNWSLKMLADKADLPYETVKKLISRKIGKQKAKIRLPAARAPSAKRSTAKAS